MRLLTRGVVLAMWLIADAALLAAVIWTRKPAHLDTAPTQIPRSISDMSDFGERARPRARGSAPPLNPLPDVSDEGVADHTRGRARSQKILPMVAVSCARVKRPELRRSTPCICSSSNRRRGF